jgi:hypothetical protein
MFATAELPYVQWKSIPDFPGAAKESKMPLVNDGTGVPENFRGYPERLLTGSDDGREPVASLTHIESRPRDPRRVDRASEVAVVRVKPARAQSLRDICRGRCEFRGQTEWHHNQLLGILSDPDGPLELLELAVTWAELDYSSRQVIAPHRWTSFLNSHNWPDPERAERIFSLATDVAMTATRAAGR